MIVGEVVLNETLFGALAAGVTGVILGLVGWVLSQAVALGKIVARLEATTADLERRIERIESNG